MVPFSLTALEIAAWDDEESTACISFLDSEREVLDRPNPKPLSLTDSDFRRGDPLGSGSFATVYEIEALSEALLDNDFPTEHQQPTVVYPPLDAAGRWDSHSIDSMIETIATSTTDGDLSSATPDSSVHLSWGSSSQQKSARRRRRRYVVKCLNERVRSDPNYTHVGLLGLQREAEILGELPFQHPNVISLIGVGGDLLKRTTTNTANNEEQQASQAFLVLGRLEQTLEDRLKRLRKGGGSTTNSLKKPVTLLQNIFSGSNSQEEVYEQQARCTQVGLGLAQALQFLHSQGVLFRDLKPSNVGFDASDNVRLFDFGLSRKIVQQQDNDGENARKLTSCVGSLRFMSPEMYKGEPYNFPSDVHSFGILLWEVLTLERPFSNARSRHQFVDIVYTRQQRPSLKNICSPAIKELLAATWDPIPERRPSFATIVECLQAESQKLL